MIQNLSIRLFAWLGIVGSIVMFITGIYGMVTNDDSMVGGLLFTLASLLILFGIISIYWSQVEILGKFGIIGFIGMIVGAVWVISLDWMFTFIMPALVKLVPDIKNQAPPFPVNIGMLSVDILIALGWVLFGLSLLLKSQVSRWAGLVLLVAGLAVIIPNVGDNVITPLLTSVAVLWLCLQVIKGKKA